MPAIRARRVHFLVGFVAVVAVIPALVWAVEQTLVPSNDRDRGAPAAADPGASAEPLAPAPRRVAPLVAPKAKSTGCARRGHKCRAGHDRKRDPVRHARIELAPRPDSTETAATGKVTPVAVNVEQPQIAATIERERVRLVPNQRTTDVTGAIEDLLEDPVGETVERVDDVAAPVITLVEDTVDATDQPIQVELPSEVDLPVELPLPAEPGAEPEPDAVLPNGLELSPRAARVLTELAHRGLELRIRLVDTTR